jgi:hypothetical protein
MKTAIRSAFIAAALGACHGSSPAVAPEPDGAGSGADKTPVITLERTPCLGSCPVYRVTISSSGLVRYQGKRFVADSGADSANISAEAVANLVGELRLGGYFDFDDKYVAGASGCGPYATDLPSAITSVDDGHGSKRIEHDHGCSEAPRGLASLENKIDQVAGTGRWTGH